MLSNTAPDRPFQLLRCLSLFSNTVRFPWPCLSLFAPKPTRHLTVPQSPMLGEWSLPKMAKPLQPNLLGTQGTRPLFSYCEQPEVYSFLLWCLFHPDELLSFCSLVNWSKQEYLFHTNLRSQDECSRDSMYQWRVSIFAVDFQKCFQAHWYNSFILCY